MRGLVLVAAFGVGVAHADRFELLRGRLTIDVPGGNAVADDLVRLDTGDLALTVVARDLGQARLAEVREQIVRQLSREGEPLAPIEPLALARPSVGYSARVRAPRVVDGRELVYAAFAVDPNGSLRELAFFGDADSPERSRVVAARIAATITLRADHAPVAMLAPAAAAVAAPVPPTVPGCVHLAPTKWLPHEGDILPLRQAPVDGMPTVWSQWHVASTFNAEAIEHDVHVVCTAGTYDELVKKMQASAKAP